MVEIKHLSKKFGKKTAVDDVSYVFDKGVYGLLGPNGAGKTTLLRCMLQLYSYQGEVLIDTVSAGRQDVCIGYLPQKNSVFSGLTVEEQLKYYANLKHMRNERIAEEIDRVLKLVNLADFRKKKGNKLSGGMVRRLGIAQALLDRPRLVVLDEPTTGLDPEERMNFKNIIRQMGKESVVIMSTHIVEDVEAVCGSIVIMQNGKICAGGSQKDISKLAEGKVYEIPKAMQKESQYVERVLLIDDTEYVRVLTSEPIDAEPVKPTVEDGYLCMLKGI